MRTLPPPDDVSSDGSIPDLVSGGASAVLSAVMPGFHRKVEKAHGKEKKKKKKDREDKEKKKDKKKAKERPTTDTEDGTDDGGPEKRKGKKEKAKKEKKRKDKEKERQKTGEQGGGGNPPVAQPDSDCGEGTDAGRADPPPPQMIRVPAAPPSHSPLLPRVQ